MAKSDAAGGQRKADLPDNRPPATTLPAADPDDLEQALSAKIGELIPEPEKKQEVERVVHEVVASFQGPLPPPSLLQRYNEIVPGAAERIIAMAEREQRHRHSWEQQALAHERWYSMTGITAGWTTAVALAISAAMTGIYDDWRVGVALAAASAIGMVWKLIEGRSLGTEEQSASVPEPITPRKPRESGSRPRSDRVGEAAAPITAARSA